MAAKPDKQKVYRELVEKQLPNFRFVEQIAPDSPAPRAVADSVTPDLATLRRKFLGQDATRTRGLRDTATAEDVQPDTGEAAIVRVEPKNAGPWSRGAGAKAVVISKGKIIGMQG